MDDRFDSPALSDFPADAPPSHDWVIWLITLLFLVGLTVALVIVFKRAERRAASGAAIEERAKAVMAFLSPGAKATRDSQKQMAINSWTEVKSQFGQTLELSRQLSDVVGKLSTAVEGTEKKPFVAKPSTGASDTPGSATINIAINAHAATPVVAATAENVPSGAKVTKVSMTPDEKEIAIWLAIQKLFDYWKNLMVVTESYRAALRQLTESPPWVPPQEGPVAPGKKAP